MSTPTFRCRWITFYQSLSPCLGDWTETEGAISRRKSEHRGTCTSFRRVPFKRRKNLIQRASWKSENKTGRVQFASTWNVAKFLQKIRVNDNTLFSENATYKMPSGVFTPNILWKVEELLVEEKLLPRKTFSFFRRGFFPIEIPVFLFSRSQHRPHAAPAYERTWFCLWQDT